jgi:hypothetical protein
MAGLQTIEDCLCDSSSSRLGGGFLSDDAASVWFQKSRFVVAVRRFRNHIYARIISQERQFRIDLALATRLPKQRLTKLKPKCSRAFPGIYASRCQSIGNFGRLLAAL